MAGRPRPDEAEVPLYTVVDGVHIAYATFGSEPSDVLLLTPGLLSVDSYLDEPGW